MASQQLIIAQAALSASLFRADPTSVSRSSIDTFLQLLGAAVTRCSRPNVQKCRAWLVDNVSHSQARTAALAKFLAALSRSWAADGQRPSLKRRRLHMLLVLNDVLHHVVARRGDAKFSSFWDAQLPSIVAAAAAFEKAPKHKKKLEDLIGIWADKGYFSSELLSKLHDAVATGTTETATAVDTTSSVKLAKDVPYVLPSVHGDSSAPWYDLPATTWLPHLIPGSTKPMVPDLIRPIQLAAGPADKNLADAVRTLLSDVERLFSREKKWDDDPLVDINELGERIVRDEATGAIVGGGTYYGWSRAFCEKMMERKRRPAGKQLSRSRSSSRSRSPFSDYFRGRSRSSSPRAFKRRRMSSHSRGRSPIRDRRGATHSRTRSPSRSRSRSPARRYNGPYRRRSRTRSPSYSPSRKNYPAAASQPPPPFSAGMLPNMASNMPPNMASNIPPNMPPMIPPPPAGYTGPWPPPPPPPPPSMGGPSPQNWFPNPGMMAHMPGWSGPVHPRPPPPPPPPQYPLNNQYPQNNQYGRGGHNGYYGRGRGGYDYGRGR